MDFREIDGSQGEGGGQILRLASVFSVIKNEPIRITKIRAGREVPGLKKQHVAALQVLAEVCHGQLAGDNEGSTEVTFAPGKPSSGKISVDMKTAASITLVLQAAVPAAAVSGTGLDLELVGGTDVPWSPTFDYFDLVAKPAYASMGIEFESKVRRRGFYPKGGGIVQTKVKPSKGVRPIVLSTPETPKEARMISRCANLPRRVAERQSESAEEVLRSRGIRVGSSVVSVEDAISPGSSILVYSDGIGKHLGSDAIGARGKPAEEVGRQAGEGYSNAAATGASIDANLADMVGPLLSLAQKPSQFRVPRITTHLETGLSVARQFTGCSFSFAKEQSSWLVGVDPIGKP